MLFRSPVAMPAGILTVIFRSRVTRPSPRQSAHGLATMRPAPWHRGQGRETVKNPCWKRTWPWPWHWAQVVGVVPAAAPVPRHVSQASCLGIWMGVSTPPAYGSAADLTLLRSDDRQVVVRAAFGAAEIVDGDLGVAFLQLGGKLGGLAKQGRGHPQRLLLVVVAHRAADAQAGDGCSGARGLGFGVGAEATGGRLAQTMKPEQIAAAQRKAINDVVALLRHGPGLSLDELQQRLGLPAPELLARLTELELADRVRRAGALYEGC